MAFALNRSDHSALKRTRGDLLDDCVDSASTVEHSRAFKRLHKDPGILVGFPLSQQLSPSPDAALGRNEPVSGYPDEKPAAVPVSLERKNGVQLFQEGWDGQLAEVGDSTSGSCLASYEASSTGYSSGVDGSEELFASDYQSQHLCKGTLQAAESCCGDDTQVDINCFLESWDDEVGGLFSAPSDLFDDNNCCLPSDLAGASDTLSRLDEMGEGDWFFGDVVNDSKRFWNEAPDQEWMTVAVASLDRLTDTLETDGSMLHLLEAGTGN